MDVYVERWLLDLKGEAARAGLEAHVRALDGKGGERLAFELHDRGEAVELRYAKRRTGARQIAAATGAEIAARAREVHAAQLRAHHGLLENGRRRFLRRSVRLLAALEDALGRGSVGRPAAARVTGHLRKRIEVVPAAIGDGMRLAASIDGRAADLSELLPVRKRRAGKPGAADRRLAVVDAGEVVGHVAEHAVSCLGDAACAGIDCGAIDCFPG